MRSHIVNDNRVGADVVGQSYENALETALSQLKKVEINKARDYNKSNAIVDLKTRLQNGRNSEAKNQGLAALQINNVN